MQEGSTVEKKDVIRDMMTPSGLVMNTTANTRRFLAEVLPRISI